MCITCLKCRIILIIVIRGRSQLSTFMKAYREYARVRGSGTTVRFFPENQHFILLSMKMYYKTRNIN